MSASEPTPGPTRFGARWFWYLLLLASAWVVISLLALAIRSQPIENDLTARSKEALTSIGQPAAEATYSGRDATVRGAFGPDGVERVRATVEKVRGNRVVDVIDEGAPSRLGLSDAGKLTLGVADGKLTLDGSVPSEEAKRRLLELARGPGGARQVVDNIQVDPSAPSNSLAVASQLVGAVLGTQGLEGGERTVTVSGRTVTLAGSVPSDDARAAAEGVVRRVLPGAEINNRLRVDTGDGSGAGDSSSSDSSGGSSAGDGSGTTQDSDCPCWESFNAVSGGNR